MSAHLFPSVFPALGAIAAATLRDAGFDAFVEVTPLGDAVTVRLERPDAIAGRVVGDIVPGGCVVTKLPAGLVLQAQSVTCDSSAVQLSRFVRHLTHSATSRTERLVA